MNEYPEHAGSTMFPGEPGHEVVPPPSRTQPYPDQEITPSEARHHAPARTASRRAGRRRFGLAIPLALGLAAFLLGLALALTTPTKYAAYTELVVLPGKATTEESASLFDTLSKGQIVATSSEILSQSRWRQGYPDVTISAGGVTPSAVISVTASGTDRETVSRSLNDVVTRATPTVNRAIAPYRVMRLSPADVQPVASPTGLGRSTMMLAALILGLVTAALTAAVMRLLGRSTTDG